MINIGPETPPLSVFTAWMMEAKQQGQIKEPMAMTLATVGRNGLHARIVLCKEWSDQGFVFYTNYQSRKGLDLEHNAQAAAVFYWDPMFRQVCISGSVSKTTRQNSEAYWKSRPRESQLSQFISLQSQPLESRELLEKARADAEREFHGKEIPCPAQWGGYVLAPKRIEFWVGKPERLHDRFEFEKTQNHWTFRRLYP